MGLQHRELGRLQSYLAAMRPRRPVERDWYSMMVRSGAYVGEVIRRNSTLDWHWLKYETALQIEPRLAQDADTGVPSQWVLWDGAAGFAFPLGNVVRYYQLETADSITSFVSELLQQV